MAEHTKKHDKTNPEQAKHRSDLRRLRESTAEGSYSSADIMKIREELGNCCAYCGLMLNNNGHVDHKTPLAKGGNNLIENLTLACFQCNTEKHAKTVLEYYIWRLERNLQTNGSAFKNIQPRTPHT